MFNRIFAIETNYTSLGISPSIVRVGLNVENN
jgi:hypothetical protein